jgi:hypothetical protein
MLQSLRHAQVRSLPLFIALLTLHYTVLLPSHQVVYLGDVKKSYKFKCHRGASRHVIHPVHGAEFPQRDGAVGEGVFVTVGGDGNVAVRICCSERISDWRMPVLSPLCVQMG